MIDIKKLKPRYITDDKGNKVELILPIEVFRALLEDLQDLALHTERMNEATVSHQDLLEELKTDGLL